MYIKIVGAFLVIFGCGGFGFLVAANHRYEEKMLRQLLAALEQMHWELQYRLTPLPELCNNAAAICSGYVRNVLIALGAALGSQQYASVKECMKIVLLKEKNASSMARDVFIKLGQSLGQYGLDGQVNGLQVAREDCKRHLDLLSQNQAARLRSYQTLGLCAGAGLAIIFI